MKVSQDELTQHLVQGAAQYGMEPDEFVKVLSENGQIAQMVGEVARNKALAIVLGRAQVSDSNGNAVDLHEFTAVAEGSEEPTVTSVDVPLTATTVADVEAGADAEAGTDEDTDEDELDEKTAKRAKKSAAKR